MRKPSLAVFALLAALVGCGSPPPPEPPPAPPPAPAPPAPATPPPSPAASASAAPATSAAAASPPAADDKFASVVIKAEKVSGVVYMLEGSGGNIGVSVGDDGIVIVDDQFAPLAPKIKEALKGITDRPVRFVINTHWHGDHTGGNVVFGPGGASVIAHENVRKRMASGHPKIEIAGKTLDATPPAPKEALPIVTFQDKVSVHLNGEEIRAIHIPSGHTDGDAIIYFTKSNVVHMGDDFVTYGFPFVDLTSGGSVEGLIAAIDKAVRELPPDVKVIPGHGKVSSIEDMKKLSATLKECVKLVKAEVKKKKTLEQIQQAKVLAKYEDMGKGFVKPEMFVEMVFKELTKQQNVFVPH